MKKLLTLLFSLATLVGSAQNVPYGISYQAIALDQNGQPIPGIDIVGRPIDDAEIGVRFTILDGSASGPEIYQEEHEVLTDLYGMFQLVIGQGLQVSAEGFSDINWVGEKFLKVEISVDNNGSFELSAVQQLMSVPYSFLAQDVINNDDADADPTNEIQTLSIVGDSVKLTDGGAIRLPIDPDTDPVNEIQFISLSGDTVFLSNGGSFVLPVDPDLDSTNEIQFLSRIGDTVYLTDGGSFVLPVDPDLDSTNEIQFLSRIGDTVYLTDGGSFVLPVDPDLDSTNEIQFLSRIGDTVYLTDGGSFVLPVDPDLDSTNELQAISYSNDTLVLDRGGIALLPFSTKAESIDDLTDARNSNGSVGLGISALQNDTTGNNTAVGNYTQSQTQSGSMNVSMGVYSLNTNTSGGGNTALGFATLGNNTIGNSNTAVGLFAMAGWSGATTGYANTGVGSRPLAHLTTGSTNVAVGSDALFNLKTGSNNIAFGDGVGNGVITGNNNIFIGSFSNASDSAIENAVAIGFGAQVHESATIQLGNEYMTKVSTYADFYGKGGAFTDSTTSSEAIVSMNSNTKGFLPPRMTEAERDLISNPSAGLIIYCTDCGTGEIQSFNGVNWSSSLFSNTVAEPSVRTNAATIASNYQVIISGTVLTDGGANLSRKGLIRSTDPNFSTADTIVVSGGIGIYLSDTIAPSFNTTYYYKAFAENQLGRSFGYVASYYLPDTTGATASSVVTLDSISNVSTQSATLYGAVVSANGTVVQRGFVLDTLPQPTIDDVVVSGGTQLGNFNEVKNGLTSNGKTYYVRSYLITSIDTTYSNQLSFTTAASSSYLSVGQTFQGGIIFYLADDGQSGLIVTASNIGTTKFGCEGTEIGGTSQGLWSGKQNTDRILSVCSESNTASAMCASYVHQGYDDWYLPSWDELIVMRQNLHNNGIGNFSWWLWSSSEVDANRANSHDMSCGAYLSKSSQGGVRAVRTFTLSTSTTSAPTLAITGTSSNSFNSISVAGTISEAKANKVFETGVVYSSTNTTPTTSDNLQSLSEYAPYNCGPTIVMSTYEGSSFLGNVQGLSSNTTYYMRAYAKTPNGTYYSSVETVETDSLYLAAGSGMTDIDGNTYTSIIVGDMEWSVENLRVSKFNNGDAIPNVSMGSNWSSTTTAAHAYYSNDPTYNLVYGKWYNWYAVDDSRGLCPTGWHVATNQEWLDLEIMLGGASLAGGVLKSTSSLWNNSSVVGTDEIGFSALPNGFAESNGNSNYMNYYGYFWTSTSYDSNRSYFRELRHDSQYLTSPYGRIISPGYGMACRCVKD
jgi:uncharacterized protein (TIGR02145 family)